MFVLIENASTLLDLISIFAIVIGFFWAQRRVKAAESRAKASLEGQYLSRIENTVDHVFSSSPGKCRAGIAMLENLAKYLKVRDESGTDFFGTDDLIQTLESAMLDRSEADLWRRAVEAIPILNNSGALGRFTLPKSKEVTFTIHGREKENKALLYGVDFTSAKINGAKIANCVLYDCRIGEDIPNNRIQFSGCVAVVKGNDSKQVSRDNNTEGIQVIEESQLHKHLKYETRCLLRMKTCSL